MDKPNWRATALAVATAALFGVASLDANALGLGRVTVQSALGEPLRAEVDIVEVTPEELATLRANVASPEAFRAAGLEYSPALANMQVTLQHRANGRPFLLLSSSRPVNDPFIDLILETQWASGRVVRDYTMLFDPPQLRQGPATATAPIAPVTPAPAQASPRAAVPPPVAAPASPRSPVQQAVRPAAPAAAADGGEGAKVTVKKGDSAGRIAAAHKPASISLDQMLVALLQANPDAFIGANVNRLKAGAVLQIPSAEEAGQHSASDATRTIIAQSRDFNEFRRRLAEGVASAPVAASDRQASGKVQTQVEEKTATAPTPDKLTLSKGAVQGKSAAEDKIARDREAKDAATRLAELNKNIADLNRLSSATAPGAAPAATSAASKPATRPATAAIAASAPSTPASTVATTAPQLPVSPPVAAAKTATPASAPAAAASASGTAPVATVAALAASGPAATAALPASAPAPAMSAASGAAPSPAAAASGAIAQSAAAASGPAKPKLATPPPAEEPGLFDDLLDNPLLLAGIGLVVALLAGLGVYRVRQRKKGPQVDSSFLESRLQPDSFFGASGGQRIDTNEGSATGSSMVYSPSQLDAAGDVDPVAEADVYLAYGRDLQAEEILKEALRISPQRVAIHSKLLEIYSKRRDAKAFEVAATDAYALTNGEGPEWERICELGRELDATNSLYRPGGQPSVAPAGTAAAAAAAGAAALESPATTSPDLDLDLDFSLGDDAPEPHAPESAAAQTTGPVHLHSAPEPAGGLDLDFGGAGGAVAPAAVDEGAVSFELPIDAPVAPAAPVASAEPAASAHLEQPENALDFDMEPAAEVTPAPGLPSMAHVSEPAADAKMIEFDLGELSLDLDASASASASASATATAAPVAAGTPATIDVAAPALQIPKTEKFHVSPAETESSTQGLDDGGGDPLATKFALAQEFNAIGDPDGARSLAEEVLAEASGELKNRAQKFLAEIG